MAARQWGGRVWKVSMNTVHKGSCCRNFIEHRSGKTETPARLLMAGQAGMLWQKTRMQYMGWLRLFKGELVREAQQWVEQGLVQREQAERILERFDTSFDDRHHWSLGYMVLVGLAILSMGLALFLWISHNWDEWPRAARMAGLVLVTLGLHVHGIRCYAQQRIETGTRWLFAGALSYGASIMLIAQIYHLGEHFPDGLYWWALGVLPVALLTRSQLLHGMQWLLATFWFVSEARYGLGWSYPLFLLALGWQLVRYPTSRLLVFGLLWGSALW